jgi:hypothetical protein
MPTAAPSAELIILPALITTLTIMRSAAHIAEHLVISPGPADDGSMAAVPQFVVTFRGAEVGRYETADRAMAAARSVIDTELASRSAAADHEPGELPRIEWQPPRVPFPFDASAYWRQRVQSQPRDVKSAPTAAPTSQISLQNLGAAGDESRPPRRHERLQSDGPPAPVRGGPPAQVRGGPSQQRPAQQRPAQQRPAPPAQPAPMYGGPQWAGPTPPPLPPVPEPQLGAPAPPPAEEPRAGRRRWFGKNRDRSQ